MTLPTPLRDQISAVEQAASATDLLLATQALAGRLAEVADAPPDGSELEEAIATLVQVLGFNNWPARIPGASSALFARNLLTFLTTFWDKEAKAPKLPAEILEKTAAKYREALTRLTAA